LPRPKSSTHAHQHKWVLSPQIVHVDSPFLCVFLLTIPLKPVTGTNLVVTLAQHLDGNCFWKSRCRKHLELLILVVLPLFSQASSNEKGQN
jgi:hypothetical protein